MFTWGGIMIKKNFTFDEILKLRLFNDTGSEGILFDYDEVHLLKKYNDIFFCNEKHLEEVIYAQKYINGTTLPLGIGYFNNVFFGSILKKFPNAKSLTQMPNLCSTKDLLLKLKELLECMQELTDNGLFPIDIDTENVLIVNNKIEIIDLDARGIVIDNKNNMELIKRCLTLYKTIVLDTLFLNNSVNFLDNNMKNSLPISNYDLLDCVMSNNVSYEIYYDILKYLIDDKDFVERGQLYVKS